MSSEVEIRAPAEQTEGTRSQILRWLKAVGESVTENEPLIELETDKVTVEVPAPGSGTLREILKQEQDEIGPGELLGRIEAPSAAQADVAAASPSNGAPGDPAEKAAGDVAKPASAAAMEGASDANARAYAQNISPAVRRLLAERGLEVSDVRGTGQGGRITVADVLAASAGTSGTVAYNAAAATDAAQTGEPMVSGEGLGDHGRLGPSASAGRGDRGEFAALSARDGRVAGDASAAGSTARPAQASAGSTSRSGQASAESVGTDGGAVAHGVADVVGPSHRVPHTATRKRIAQHMVQSLLHTAPHVTTVFEADLTAVLEHRQRNKDDFARRGAPLTLTAYFLQATVAAIRAVPEANSRWTDSALEVFDSMHIGVATALETGLVVPVLRDVQSRDLFETAKGLDDLVSRARDGHLTPADVRGGTFTISNHGVSGSLVATPIIINQPQSAILGVGKLEKRPVVLTSEDGEDRIVIRPRCYVTLTIDHRVMDGHQANRFLQTFLERLATPQ